MRRIFLIAIVACIAAAAPSAFGSGSGIRGRVTAGPTCPVERNPPDPQCAPRGVQVRVQVRRRSDRRLVASLTTGSDGRFRVRLRPGRYLVAARAAGGKPYPRCPAERLVTVAAGRYANVAIGCDSGIR